MAVAVPLRLVAVLLALAPLAAGAAPIRYSWSGSLEPGDAPGNPWNLAGDGSAVTQDDGTPFALEVFVDEAATDTGGAPDTARFAPTSATLLIGGNAASLTDLDIAFGDDTFGTLDRIVFDATATFLGVTLNFSAEVRIPIGTYALADTDLPDLPPTWTPTTPVQFGAFAGDIRSYPADAPVTGELVPEPASAALLALGLCGLGVTRPRRAARAR